MTPEMRRLCELIQEQGFGVEFRSHEDRLVCAEHRLKNALVGRSVWVAQKFGLWYVATWVPHLYEASSTVRIGELIVELFRSPLQGSLYTIPSELCTKFKLRELSPQEVEVWMSDIVEQDDD